MALKLPDMSGDKAGFTLVELLVVIVLLGILASLALLNIAGQEERAEKGVIKNNMRALVTELEAEKNQEGEYPASLDTLDSSAAANLMEEEGIHEFEYARFNEGGSYQAVAGMELEDDSVYIVISPEGLREFDDHPDSSD